MGYIPLFVTLGGACLLFFLTVKHTLSRKRSRHQELLQELTHRTHSVKQDLKSSSVALEQIIEQAQETAKTKPSEKDTYRIIQELKINRHHYNQLIRKAPYNWVAKLGGFHKI